MTEPEVFDPQLLSQVAALPPLPGVYRYYDAASGTVFAVAIVLAGYFAEYGTKAFLDAWLVRSRSTPSRTSLPHTYSAHMRREDLPQRSPAQISHERENRPHEHPARACIAARGCRADILRIVRTADAAGCARARRRSGHPIVSTGTR